MIGGIEMGEKRRHAKKESWLNKHSSPSNNTNNNNTTNRTNIKQPHVVMAYYYLALPIQLIYTKKKLRYTMSPFFEKSNLQHFYIRELGSCIDEVEQWIEFFASTDQWIQFKDATIKQLKRVYYNASDWIGSLSFGERKSKRAIGRLKGFVFEGINASFLYNNYLVTWKGWDGFNKWLEASGRGEPDIKVFYNNKKWITIECKYRSNRYYYLSERELKQVLDVDVAVFTYKPINKEIESCYYILTGTPTNHDMMSHLLWLYTIFTNQLQAYHPIIKLLTSRH